MGHAVHPDAQLPRDRAVEDPQPVVRIGEVHLARHRTQRHHQTQRDPLQQRHPVLLAIVLIEETGAQDDVGEPAASGVDHAVSIGDPMLTVRVEGHEELTTRTGQRVAQPGLQSRTLSQVDRVANQMRRGSSDLRRGSIGAAVVDAHDVAELCVQVSDHLRDHGDLVVHGDDHPCVVIGHLRLLIAGRGAVAQVNSVGAAAQPDVCPDLAGGVTVSPRPLGGYPRRP